MNLEVLLSGFLGAILGGILSFLGAIKVFNLQKKYDLKKDKINKALDLVQLINGTGIYMAKFSNGSSYKNPFSNMSDKDELHIFLNYIFKIRVDYKFITNRTIDLNDEIQVINQYFITREKERDTSTESKLINNSTEILRKITEIRDEVEKFILENSKWLEKN